MQSAKGRKKFGYMQFLVYKQRGNMSVFNIAYVNY